MTVYSGADFVITGDSPADNIASTPTVTILNTPVLPEDTVAVKTTVGTPYSISTEVGSITFGSLAKSTSYSKPIELTCTISGGGTISYALQPNGANTLLTWVTLDDTNKLLNFTTPSVDSTYTFNIVATESGTDYAQTVYLEVKDVLEDKISDGVQAAITTILGRCSLCDMIAPKKFSIKFNQIL
jgi:hypothetical protein